MGKAAQDLTLLDLCRSRAVLGLFNDLGKIFLFANLTGDVLTARISGCAGGVETVFVAVPRRNNAVSSHENRSVEALKFFLLFPPCVSIVADKVRILLKGRVVVGRKHLGVGVDIHSGALGLF